MTNRPTDFRRAHDVDFLGCPHRPLGSPTRTCAKNTILPKSRNVRLPEDVSSGDSSPKYSLSNLRIRNKSHLLTYSSLLTKMDEKSKQPPRRSRRVKENEVEKENKKARTNASAVS